MKKVLLSGLFVVFVYDSCCAMNFGTFSALLNEKQTIADLIKNYGKELSPQQMSVLDDIRNGEIDRDTVANDPDALTAALTMYDTSGDADSSIPPAPGGTSSRPHAPRLPSPLGPMPPAPKLKYITLPRCENPILTTASSSYFTGAGPGSSSTGSMFYPKHPFHFSSSTFSSSQHQGSSSSSTGSGTSGPPSHGPQFIQRPMSPTMRPPNSSSLFAHNPPYRTNQGRRDSWSPDENTINTTTGRGTSVPHHERATRQSSASPSPVLAYNMDQIQDGCYINVTGLPFKLQVKTTLGNGNCAYSLLKITRNDFANLLSELVCTHVPNLSKVKANVRQTVLFDVNQAIARGNKENADGWELALAKEDAAARTSGLSDYALDTHNIIFYINNFVRLEPASFTETYHVANFYNTLDLGIGGLGVVAATALGIPIHIITIPDDGQFNEDLDNATVITVTGNQDLYDLTGLFEANQQGGALTSKLVQSEPGAKVLYLLFRNGNHYDLAIPVPKKQ